MRTVVITGAASGLGKALAHCYAKNGYQVVIADINSDAGQAVCRDLNANAHFFQCDVSRRESLDALAEFVNATCGECHILINNAGIASSGNLMDTDDAEWQRLLTINLMSCVNSCKAFIPLLKASVSAQSPGAIVNVASLAAFGLLGGMASYNVSKASVVALSESLRCELINDYIHVAAACPSFFKTNLTSSMVTSDPETIARVERWMAKSQLTAESVAEDIYRGIDEQELVIFCDKPVQRLYKIYRFIYRLLIPSNKRNVNS